MCHGVMVSSMVERVNPAFWLEEKDDVLVRDGKVKPDTIPVMTSFYVTDYKVTPDPWIAAGERAAAAFLPMGTMAAAQLWMLYSSSS